MFLRSFFWALVLAPKVKLKVMNRLLVLSVDSKLFTELYLSSNRIYNVMTYIHI